MEEECFKELLRRAREKDSAAWREISTRLSPLVSALAGRLCFSAAEREDLYQVGMMGLVKAVERYDLNAPVKFTTFASAWIRGEILNYQREKSFPIKLSRSLWEQSRTLESCRRRLCQELGREPSVGELAAVLETSPEEIAMLLEVSLPFAPLQEERLSSSESLLLEEELVERLSLQEGMKRLAPLERQLIQLRYFQELTQEEIARRLALSQRQVSRLEKRILFRLRELMQCQAGI